MTFDNGTELNGHKELTKNPGTRVYFCHPYCSTERGHLGGRGTAGAIRIPALPVPDDEVRFVVAES